MTSPFSVLTDSYKLALLLLPNHFPVGMLEDHLKRPGNAILFTHYCRLDNLAHGMLSLLQLAIMELAFKDNSLWTTVDLPVVQIDLPN